MKVLVDLIRKWNKLQTILRFCVNYTQLFITGLTIITVYTVQLINKFPLIKILLSTNI